MSHPADAAVWAGWNNFVNALANHHPTRGLATLIRHTMVDDGEEFDLKDDQDEDRVVSLRAPFWSNNLATSGAFTVSAGEKRYLDNLSLATGGLSIDVEYRPFVRYLHVVLPLDLCFANTVQASAVRPNHFGLPHTVIDEACSDVEFPQMRRLKLEISFPYNDVTDTNVVHPPLFNATIRRVVTAAKDSGFRKCQVDVALTDANHEAVIP